VSFYNSQVDGIVGPYNRLDQQPHMSGNLGMDYRVRSVPLTVGGNLNITPAYYTQSSNEQLVSVSQKRVIDLYGLWKVDPMTAWRLTFSNLDPLNYTTSTLYNTVGVIDDSTSTNRSYVNVQLRWEKKL
jgi:outer membrane receptor for ferrienterochelin and colicins